MTPAEARALVQGSPEWKTAKAGSVGASDVADIIRKVKSGNISASRKNLLWRLAVERLTGKLTNGFVSKAMQNGKDREAQAKAWYQLTTGNEPRSVGIVLHPTIVGAHASPDAEINDDGLYEGKAPEQAQHGAMLTTGIIEPDYLTQMQWQMACDPNREWCEFVSYNPDFPEEMQVWSKVIMRDAARIAELEAEVSKFLSDLDDALFFLRKRYGDVA